MFDLIIKNGEIVDGSGEKRKKADLAIIGEKIVEIGDLSSQQAETVIDASGKVISPGFIDMHSHTDLTLPAFPAAESLIHQGITTVFTGHCGISPVPLEPDTKDLVVQAFGDADVPMPWEKLNNFGSFLDLLEEVGVAVNVHPLMGQGNIRAAVMGFSADRPNEDQMAKMQRLVEESLDQGAVGISTGLIYPPGSYASTEELIEVTKPVGKRGMIYASHVRGEGDTLLEAIEEEIRIGRVTGARIHHSHYKAAGASSWNLAEPGLELISKARREGLTMTADMYPYTAGATSLVAILPEWAQEGGFEEIAKRLQDKAAREKITASMKTEGFFKLAEWDKVLIPGSANPAHVGKYIAELAETEGKTPYNWIFDALLETKGQIGMILFMMDEENVKMQLTHESMMIGTDGAGVPMEGPTAEGGGHPRAVGTYPRVLGKYVREEKVLTLEDAVWRMSGYPAQTLGLNNRGLVKKGYQADLVIFDPETIIDKADFINTYQKAEGIDYVFVNGQIVVKDKKTLDARPGQVTSR